MLKLWNPEKHPVLRDVALVFLFGCWLFGWYSIVRGASDSNSRLLVAGVVVVGCLGIVLVQGWRRRP